MISEIGCSEHKECLFDGMDDILMLRESIFFMWSDLI